MATTFQVITSLQKDGSNLLGTKVLAVRIADESIVSGSLLTVEGNEFCVLKSRGAVLNVYEAGQYSVTTPDKLLVGSVVQSFFGGNSPWVYEVIYINRSKLVLTLSNTVNSLEMIGVWFHVDSYIHVDTKAGALNLVQHLPFSGHVIDVAEIVNYAKPVISQAIAQIVQLTPITQLSQRLPEIREVVRLQLAAFLSSFGILLSDIKIIVCPDNQQIRDLLTLQSAMGLNSEQTLRYYLAIKMAEKGLITAPNAAVGTAFNVSLPALPKLPNA